MKIKFLESFVALMSADSDVERKAHESNLKALINSLHLIGDSTESISIARNEILLDIHDFANDPSIKNRERLKPHLLGFSSMIDDVPAEQLQ